MTPGQRALATRTMMMLSRTTIHSLLFIFRPSLTELSTSLRVGSEASHIQQLHSSSLAVLPLLSV